MLIKKISKRMLDFLFLKTIKYIYNKKTHQQRLTTADAVR